MLGMKFCIAKNPNFKLLKEALHEAIRKISWKVFFLKNPSNSKDSDFLIKCKKDFRNISKKELKKCPNTNELFNKKSMFTNFFASCSNFKFKDSHIFEKLMNDFKQFCLTNKIMIIEADKNAGICVVNKSDYDKEVMRQLNDLNTYHPSTHSAFNLAMIEFNDKANRFYKKLPSSFNLRPLSFEIGQPAKFYILPKVHKEFQTFPKGRPISSTFRKNNKYVSRLLETVLKPCMYEITDLLIDTQHFLLLLNDVKLDPTKKYQLLTIDIEALYPSLLISDCKKHCSESYMRNKNKLIDTKINLNMQEILDLLGLSLDYSYVSYQDQMFYQYKGIEMGNAASVAVANITVFHEIHRLFCKKEVQFYKRFLDDVFIILDVTDIENPDTWVNTNVNHKYLKFTHDSNEKSINFLDVKVILNDDNTISTELFTKPVSKHVYLHAKSDHPTHLKNSLFFSQGLRIIRLCSNFDVRIRYLTDLHKKFLDRGYSPSTLYNTFLKLIQTDRLSILKPKKPFLLNYLHVQNKSILEKFDIIIPNTQFSISHSSLDVYIVFPFFKCIKNYKKKILDVLLSTEHRKCTGEIQLYLESLNLKIVFSRTKNVKELIRV